ncbi:BlaI/MecI/CopY family transcriptional regulator [Actinoplanes sp. NPDC049596]|uniref:BlaI/MecI/CopY family transcriptional regulator n=1 Tax=unclassified Actinoplanes TaxID=2626549 RepID=UPI00341DE38E
MHADDEEAPGRRQAGALESEILRVLVAAGGPLTPRDVLGRLRSRLSYSTVVTVLTRMYEKGVLARFKDGRSFRYAPLTDEASMVARKMGSLLDTGSDRATVLRRFVGELQPGDEDLLRRLLADAEED